MLMNAKTRKYEKCVKRWGKNASTQWEAINVSVTRVIIMNERSAEVYQDYYHKEIVNQGVLTVLKFAHEENVIS